MDNVDNRQHVDQSGSGRSKHDDSRTRESSRWSGKSDWSESFRAGLRKMRVCKWAFARRLQGGESES